MNYLKSLLTVLLVLLLAVQAEAQGKTKLTPEERKAMIQEKRAARKAEGAGGAAKKKGGAARKKEEAAGGAGGAGEPAAETSEVQGSLRVSIMTIPDKFSSSFEKLNKQIVFGSPTKKTSGKCPLVISLHGSGGATKEISFFRQSPGIKTFSSPPGNKYGAKVIVPQSGKTWTPAELDKMLDYVLETDSDIDVNRIYCVGYSMGGKGTWEWAMHSPKRFAAVIPKAFIPDLGNIKEMVDLPIWALVGSDDQKERAEGIPAMEKALKALGSKVVKATVFPGENHGSAGGAVKDMQAELHEWLFSHSLSGD